jgi:type II secretory pathway component HofQ
MYPPILGGDLVNGETFVLGGVFREESTIAETKISRTGGCALSGSSF